MKIDSIIFDLDGTLWNAGEAILDIWNNVIADKYPHINRIITLEELNSIMGLTLEDIANNIFSKVDKPLRMEILKCCCSAECEYLRIKGGILYPNIENVLKKLKKQYKLFIVSNCQCGYVEAFMEAHNLQEYFTDFENNERTGLAKGKNIKLIIERNNLKNPIYVGDTIGDYDATKECNIPFVYAKYGFGRVKDAEHEIASFEQLINVIEDVE